MIIKMHRIKCQSGARATVDAELHTMGRFHKFLAWASMILLSLVLVSCTRSESTPSGQGLDTMLAGEAVRLAGAAKSVVLIIPKWAANSTAEERFKTALKKQGISITYSLSVDVGDPMGHYPLGLKSPDFFDALEKGGNAGAIVSLAGPPLLDAQNIAQINPIHPPVLVVATSLLGVGPSGDILGIRADRRYLGGLLDAKIVQTAIVDGDAQPDIQSAGGTDAAQQSLVPGYSIIRSNN